jgi:multicomponent Na+:H+ antiporter subunit D
MTRADWLLSLPLILPLFACAATAILGGRRVAMRTVTLSVACLHLACAVMLFALVQQERLVASQVGDWQAPFGITLQADLFGATMLVLASLIYVAIGVHALGEDAAPLEAQGWHPLIGGLMLGLSGAFLAGDLFNLYVWFEVMLIASCGLLVLGRGRAQYDAALKYGLLNLVATTVFLIAVGMLYGLTGTLNMADLARRVADVPNGALLATVGFLLLASFAAKAAVFPLFFWLPAAYHAASVPVGAVFAALMTKVGVYVMLRTFTLIFPADIMPGVGPLLALAAAATMLAGGLGALAHWDLRRIAAFQVVGGVGFMLAGLAIGTPLALAASVLYVVNDVFVKANLFLLVGAIRRRGGSFALAELGGLWKRDPLLAILFGAVALSLAGLPPLAGFWGKFLVLQAALEGGAAWLAAVALVAGLLNLIVMLRIWTEAFWKAAPVGAPAPDALDGSARLLMLAPIGALAAVTVVTGLWPEPLVALALAAGEQMADRSGYIAVIFGSAAP